MNGKSIAPRADAERGAEKRDTAQPRYVQNHMRTTVFYSALLGLLFVALNLCQRRQT